MRKCYQLLLADGDRKGDCDGRIVLIDYGFSSAAGDIVFVYSCKAHMKHYPEAQMKKPVRNLNAVFR